MQLQIGDKTFEIVIIGDKDTGLPINPGGGVGGGGDASVAKQNEQITLLGAKTTSVTALETGGVGIIGWLSQIWRDLVAMSAKTPTLALTRTVVLNAITTATAQAAPSADTGRAPSWSFSLTGTGALTATILVQARNVASGEWGTLATVSMSGTTAVGDIAATVVRYMEYRVNCTAINGTGATLTATMAA